MADKVTTAEATNFFTHGETARSMVKRRWVRSSV